MASDLRQESHERSRSNALSQSARGHGSTEETLRQSELRYQGELAIHAAQGINIEIERIDGNAIRQTVDAMAEANPNPELAWLQEMERRGDVDWRQVDAIHDSWSHSQSGLGPGAALAVSIVAAELAGGNVNDGAWVAGQVESYNRQLHTRERELARDLMAGYERRVLRNLETSVRLFLLQ